MIDSDNLNKLRQELILDEGISYVAYKDSLGYLTIGVGRLIDGRKGNGLSQQEVEYLLDNDIKNNEKQLDAFLPWWRQLTLVRQRVLLNMCFNLGIAGLLKFKVTLSHMKSGNYSMAAIEMLNSNWAKQVGDRAKRLSEMMKRG